MLQAITGSGLLATLGAVALTCASLLAARATRTPNVCTTHIYDNGGDPIVDCTGVCPIPFFFEACWVYNYSPPNRPQQTTCRCLFWEPADCCYLLLFGNDPAYPLPNGDCEPCGAIAPDCVLTGDGSNNDPWAVACQGRL